MVYTSGPQYTSCVKAEDFEPIDRTKVNWLIGLGIGFGAAGIFFPLALWVSLALLIEALHYVSDFLLNHKLICLPPKKQDWWSPELVLGQNLVCAIGEVGEFEVVGEDKNNVDNIDNDYCINLILAPIDLSIHDYFASNSKGEKNEYGRLENNEFAKKCMQGDLISLQNGMPTTTPPYSGYDRDFVWLRASGNYYNWHDIVGHSGNADEQEKNWENYKNNNSSLDPIIYKVPVLHCEFEGSRINDVLNAIDAFSFGGKWCKKNWFYGALCFVLRSVLAPALLPIFLIALGAAWIAEEGTQRDALVRGEGEVRPKDMVVMMGRWVYDGVHENSAYNELHAVRYIQKIPDKAPHVSVGTINAKAANQQLTPAQQAEIDQFKQYLKDWCYNISMAMFDLPKIGDKPIVVQSSRNSSASQLTAIQAQVLAAQLRPENQWSFHPALDGCEPDRREFPPLPK
jgi:hypothetical protein